MARFEVVRTAETSADPARVHGLVNDFRAWREWSPWEGLDPHMERTYSGPATGVGSSYGWSGNRKAGAGSMRITGSSPEEVRIALTFTKPMKASNELRFGLRPTLTGGTDITWAMTGEQTGIWGLIGRLYPMERLVGKDFERGLAQLKAVAES